MNDLITPLVSVVTPSYNYGRFLAECLASVRGQTYPRLEHIVLDALSEDTSAAVIESFQGTYDLRAVFRRDAGQADALNEGFACARGDVLCWLNADDRYLHGRVIAEAVEALSTGCDVVTGGGRYIDEKGQECGDISPNYGYPLSSLRYLDPLLQPATFWRRPMHRELRRDLHYAFDWRFFLDLQQAGATFRVVEGRWAAYRIHGAGKTAQDSTLRKREIAHVLREEWGRLSPQYLWAAAVHLGYCAADAVGCPTLKTAVRTMNDRMNRLTGGRIYSC